MTDGQGQDFIVLDKQRGQVPEKQVHKESFGVNKHLMQLSAQTKQAPREAAREPEVTVNTSIQSAETFWLSVEPRKQEVFPYTIVG